MTGRSPLRTTFHEAVLATRLRRSPTYIAVYFRCKKTDYGLNSAHLTVWDWRKWKSSGHSNFFAQAAFFPWQPAGLFPRSPKTALMPKIAGIGLSKRLPGQAFPKFSIRIGCGIRSIVLLWPNWKRRISNPLALRTKKHSFAAHTWT